jgi:hypothetical protein
LVFTLSAAGAWPVEAPFGAQLVISTAHSDAEHAVAADLDGDGDLDVLAASSGDGEIAWYENTGGSGTFGAQQLISSTELSSCSVFVADIDGDGDLDPLSTSWTHDRVARATRTSNG